ncbi:symmetrical bis(5'-nucleosyl)-tetraphosphatase [Psychrobacter sp. FDAARGOS_221]|uniref:symmetrical bis(5'-nucleosyl)-tetraphosphatase n=1 Tax=Psychrobacter sp. FDAARGOS_221 TaxID=1975705 RepID=UPI000BB54C97|nr:symmetrical bis(5'-nucleosyl)-tetraphosphatase [Psychrobacter sp. FDAARGOS_221]PNK61672.1 symmetrical bis(5'-nucleosyl)-tetraphosphatase [Psychrobacter sp. FDAARGOS_221]
MTYRAEYVIGDLQGCYAAFVDLLDKIQFDPNQDKIWFVGDIVARGEDSLATLRHVKQLCEQGAAQTVLGNHDINLIAVWRGFAPLKDKDKTRPIFEAEDCTELMDWLRKQPLLLMPNKDTVMVHAGIPPHWSVKQAKGYAREVEVQLSSSLKQLDRVLPHLYSNDADEWSESLHGFTRIRAITNYLTRMRLCKQDGTLELSFKSSLSDEMPKDFSPWFDWEVERKHKILFGHWAALKAEIDLPHARALDAGCVWGNSLLAYRLSDGKVFTTSDKCPK